MAIATGLVSSSSFSLSKILTTVFITVGFFGFALLVIPKLMMFSNGLRFNLLLKSSASGYILLICFLFSAIANALEVYVFGAPGRYRYRQSAERFKKAKNISKDIPCLFGYIFIVLKMT
jgi:hypothetical protein